MVTHRNIFVQMLTLCAFSEVKTRPENIFSHLPQVISSRSRPRFHLALTCDLYLDKEKHMLMQGDRISRTTSGGGLAHIMIISHSGMNAILTA